MRAKTGEDFLIEFSCVPCLHLLCVTIQFFQPQSNFFPNVAQNRQAHPLNICCDSFAPSANRVPPSTGRGSVTRSSQSIAGHFPSFQPHVVQACCDSQSRAPPESENLPFWVCATRFINKNGIASFLYQSFPCQNGSNYFTVEHLSSPRAAGGDCGRPCPSS